MKLFIFDVDGTIIDRDSGELLPGVKEWFANRPANAHIAFASNQGGVGLRYWMEGDSDTPQQKKWGEPEKYPTEEMAVAHVVNAVGKIMPVAQAAIYVSFAYQSKSSGKWSPTPTGAGREWQESWRKPSPGMITAAMGDIQISLRENVVMVGDSPEDMQAAEAAGVEFVWAKDFFRPYTVRFINDEDGGELERFATESEAIAYVSSVRATGGVSPDDTLRVIDIFTDICIYENYE